MSDLVLLLCEPSETTSKVAAFFRRLPDRSLPPEEELRRGWEEARWSDEDVEALWKAVMPLKASAEAEGLLGCLLRWMPRDVTLVVRDCARLLASAPPSPLRDAALAYMKRVGLRNPHAPTYVKQEASEANFAALAAVDPSAAEDWPAGELCFELGLDGHIHHLLRNPRSAMLPLRHRVQYWILLRFRDDRETTLERLQAIGSLVRLTKGNAELAELRRLGVEVFTRHWRLVPMGELARMAAEAYSELCRVQEGFGRPRVPGMFDGLDPDHLRAVWRGTTAGLEAAERKIEEMVARRVR